MTENVYVGNRAESLEVSEELPIDRVELWINDVMYYRSPADGFEGLTGKIVVANCPFGTQAMADSILENLRGVVYKPITAKGVSLDPATELGDAITVGGEYGYIAETNSTLNDRYATDVICPKDGEIKQEYNYENSVQLEQARQGAKITEMVTFEDLSTGGRTVINGDNITTGEISADRIRGGSLDIGGTASQRYGTIRLHDNLGFIVGTIGSQRINLYSNNAVSNIRVQNGTYQEGGTDRATGITPTYFIAAANLGNGSEEIIASLGNTLGNAYGEVRLNDPANNLTHLQITPISAFYTNRSNHSLGVNSSGAYIKQNGGQSCYLSDTCLTDSQFTTLETLLGI